jgi:hypothetical protein
VPASHGWSTDLIDPWLDGLPARRLADALLAGAPETSEGYDVTMITHLTDGFSRTHTGMLSSKKPIAGSGEKMIDAKVARAVGSG